VSRTGRTASCDKGVRKSLRRAHAFFRIFDKKALHEVNADGRYMSVS
jgi:hypothetical protein